MPEGFGCDFVICGKNWRSSEPGLALWGVQRKEVKDFIASISDNRLAKELAQMENLEHRILILEGSWFWGPDGTSMANQAGLRFTREMFFGVVLSLQFVHDVAVVHTSSLQETEAWLRLFATWVSKPEHHLLTHVSKPTRVVKDGLIRKKRPISDFQKFFLKGLPGVSDTLAERMIQAFPVFPLTWACSRDELLNVEGMGKRKLEDIEKVIPFPGQNNNNNQAETPALAAGPAKRKRGKKKDEGQQNQ